MGCLRVTMVFLEFLTIPIGGVRGCPGFLKVCYGFLRISIGRLVVSKDDAVFSRILIRCVSVCGELKLES